MITCGKCNKGFTNWLMLDGKYRNLSSRKFCLDCSPFGARNTRDLTKDSRTIPKTSYERVKSFRKKKKDKCIEFLGGCCSSCGYSKCKAALHIHHLDPVVKEFAISEKQAWGFEAVKQELRKCVLLCANCHAETHYPD